MIIRWLGAFGRLSDLSQSLDWEFGNRRDVAAEIVTDKSHLDWCHIGLVVKNSAARKKYRGDVWSVTTQRGVRLVPTRGEHDSGSPHQEAICRPKYAAVVVKGSISAKTWQVVREAANRHGVPVVRLCSDGELRDV